MKFSCSRNDLLNALTIAGKGVATRSPMEILEGILFVAEDQKVQLTATNQEIGVQTELEADVQEPGQAVLGANLITEIIRKLPGDEVFIESDAKNRFVIHSLLSQFNLNGLSADDYPDFPKVSQEKSFSLPSSVLRDLIRSTKDSMAVSESIPILTGTRLEVNGSNVRMVSLDGYRLALRQKEIENPVHDTIEVVIPGAALRELQKLLDDSDDPIEIEMSDSQIFFRIGKTVFTTRLLTGEFINYDRIIPKTSTTEVILSKGDLLASCDRASVLAKAGKNNLIKMDFDPDQLSITSNSDDESVHETLQLVNHGEPLRIAFNSKFFIDALKVIDDDQIKISLTNSYGPAVINPVDSDEYTYMILPVRISE